jgi:hypothetical protein
MAADEAKWVRAEGKSASPIWAAVLDFDFQAGRIAAGLSRSQETATAKRIITLRETTISILATVMVSGYYSGAELYSS